MLSQIPQTGTPQVELSEELQRQHSVPDENIPLPTALGLEESFFPVVSTEQKLREINESLEWQYGEKGVQQEILTIKFYDKILRITQISPGMFKR